MTLEFGEYLEHLRTNGARFDHVISATVPTRPVPSCPDWKASDLRDHMAGVLAFWLAQLGPEASLDGPFFPDDLGERAGQSVLALADELVVLLGNVGPTMECWNWSGADQTSGWIARRMAQETAIHRIDAELARGTTTPIDAGLAADGINELIDVHVNAEPRGDTTGSIVVEITATDVGQVCCIAATDQGVVRSNDPATAQVSGKASEVLQSLWGRPSEAEWSGDSSAPVLLWELAASE